MPAFVPMRLFAVLGGVLLAVVAADQLSAEQASTRQLMGQTCADYVCPAPGYSHKADASAISCGMGSVNGDCSKALCCLCATTTPVVTTTSSHSTCADFPCPVGWLKKIDPNWIHCPMGGCVDKNLCCLIQTTMPAPTTTPGLTTTRAPATCDGFQCPASMALKPTPSLRPCISAYSVLWPTCPGGERDLCCEAVTTTPCTTTTPKPATCASFSCGTNYALRPNPEQIMCHLPTGCNDYDKQLCCLCMTTTPAITTTKPAATCNSYNCLQFTAMVPKPNPSTLRCRNYAFCNSGDKDICCALSVTTTPRPRVTCSTFGFQCPTGTVPKPDFATKYCDLKYECNEADIKSCCDSKTSTPCPTTTPVTNYCMWMTCPTGTSLRPGAEKTVCSGTCDEDDVDRCCSKTTTTPGPSTPRPHSTCEGYVCPSHMSLKPLPQSIFCATASCGLSDMDSCCTHQTSTPCTTTTLPRQNCAVYKCVSGTTLRPNPELIFCSTPGKCTLQDEDICCKLATTTPEPTTTTSPMATSTSTPEVLTPQGDGPCDIVNGVSTTNIIGAAKNVVNSVADSAKNVVNSVADSVHLGLGLSRQDKIIGGAVIGGGLVLGGTVGAITGGVIHAQKLDAAAKLLCRTELLRDHTPGTTELDIKDNDGCFKIGDTIRVGDDTIRTITGFGSIIVDRPIMSFLKKGSPVERHIAKAGVAGKTPISGAPPGPSEIYGRIAGQEPTADAGSNGSSAGISGSMDMQLHNASSISGSLPASFEVVTVGYFVIGLLIFVACLAVCIGALFHSMHTRKKKRGKKVAGSGMSRQLRQEGDRLIVEDEEAQHSPRYAMSETSSLAVPAYYQAAEYQGQPPIAYAQDASYGYQGAPYGYAPPPILQQPQWPPPGQNIPYYPAPFEGQMMPMAASPPMPIYGDPGIVSIGQMPIYGEPGVISVGQGGAMPTYVEAGLFNPGNPGGAQWGIE